MRLKEIKPGVIHCKTQEEADALVSALQEDSRWNDYWKFYKEHTCYKVTENGLYTYGPVWSYQGDPIIEFSDLIIPESSGKELLENCWKICKEHTKCNNCPMYNNCFRSNNCDTDKVIEICEQWKADHEKKEPEFEWIWEGRIYEIHDNDRRNFYQLKDGNGFYDTGCTCQESAEDYMADVLKDYCSTHEGEYIAIVDRVCRVKR